MDENYALWGSADKSEEWMTCLTDTVEDGETILDYGCGGGRLHAFLKKETPNAKYYGLEPSYGDGPKHLEIARQYHPEGIFDFIGSYTELQAIKEADIVILGSIMTHLEYQDAVITLDKFRSVVKRGGWIITSVFMADEYQLQGKSNLYNCPNFYSKVMLTREQLQAWKFTEINTFLAKKVNLHHILLITGYN